MDITSSYPKMDKILTVPDLKKMAAKEKIDLSNKTKKEDICYIMGIEWDDSTSPKNQPKKKDVIEALKKRTVKNNTSKKPSPKQSSPKQPSPKQPSPKQSPKQSPKPSPKQSSPKSFVSKFFELSSLFQTSKNLSPKLFPKLRQDVIARSIYGDLNQPWDWSKSDTYFGSSGEKTLQFYENKEHFIQLIEFIMGISYLSSKDIKEIIDKITDTNIAKCVKSLSMYGYGKKELNEVGIKYLVKDIEERGGIRRFSSDLDILKIPPPTPKLSFDMINKDILSNFASLKKLKKCMVTKELRFGFCIVKLAYFNEKVYGHVVILVIDNYKKLGYVYDSASTDPMYLRRLEPGLQKLLQEHLDPKIKIVPIESSCPKIRIQESFPVCQSWAFYILILLLINPDVSRATIYNTLGRLDSEKRHGLLLMFLHYVFINMPAEIRPKLTVNFGKLTPEKYSFHPRTEEDILVRLSSKR